MFSTIKSYIIGISLLVVALLGSLLAYNRRETKILRKVVKSQEEALETVEVIDKVTTLIHIEKQIEEASIDQSIKSTKKKVKSVETTNDYDELDPEFIRLLNSYTD